MFQRSLFMGTNNQEVLQQNSHAEEYIKKAFDFQKNKFSHESIKNK